MAQHNELGKAGEDAAAEFLKRKGYEILHRNWKCGRKELDIVACKSGTLVIVEVKTRKTDYFGSPFDAVTEEKMKRVMVATNAYVRCYKLDCPVRFDLISVLQSYRGFKIEHIENAFVSPIW